jgi:hypothetical protein
MNIKKLLLILIIVMALFVRFYRFEDRITFDSEQGRSLIVSGNYIKEKPSLLGQELFRITQSGHKLFSGAIFNYSLVPLQILFKYNPLSITAYFALLNIATGVFLFWVVKKMFNYEVAAVSLTLFLFNSLMINHSMFIWILNYLPLIGTLILYEAYLLYKKPKLIYSFILGILLGVGINFHYVMIPFAVLLALYTLWRSKKKIITIVVYMIGLIVGNLPMILFDLRHNFYHVTTLFEYLKESFGLTGQAGLSYYHFFELWPVLVILGALIVLYIYRKSRLIGISMIGIYIYLNLTSRWVSFSKPAGMLPGLTYFKVILAAETIARDNPNDFNVTVLFGFDARGFILRYPLEFMYNHKPMGVEDYPKAKSLYILAENGYNFASSGRWELESFPLDKAVKLKAIDDRYSVYKINK